MRNKEDRNWQRREDMQNNVLELQAIDNLEDAKIILNNLFRAVGWFDLTENKDNDRLLSRVVKLLVL